VSAVALAAACLVFTSVSAAEPPPQGGADRSESASRTGGKAPVVDTWTDHLKITTYARRVSAQSGFRFSLVVEIEPGERMHVYAPGADDYQVITLDVLPQPSVRLDPVRYPASEIYHFEPLDERVPVYQKPFTLTQDATLEHHPEDEKAKGSRQLSLTGTLEYQACDDRICFSPVSVPLSWTLRLDDQAAEGSTRTPEAR
jgi:hypothetical protein